MKRFVALLLALATLLALLGGCAAGRTTVTSAMNTELTIKFETNRRGTITTDDGDLYSFKIDRRNGVDVYDITYPDGRTYSNEKVFTGGTNSFSTQDSGGTSVGVSLETAYVNAYNGDEYLGTSTLVSVLERSQPQSIPIFPVLFSLVLIVGGIVIIVKSHGIMEFFLEIRNWHKDPNMRELEHVRTVVFGIATSALGFIILIITALSAV